MDNIIVTGNSLQEHDERVKKVLKKCEDVGLKLNRNKCELKKIELVFLGEKFTDQGVKPDPVKLEPLRRWTGWVTNKQTRDSWE